MLDPLVIGDARAVYGYRSTPDVCRYQSWEPASLEEAADFIGALANNDFDTPGTWFQLAIRLRDSRALIGDVGVHFLVDARQAEIGFTLSPDRQGLGYATEAVTAVLDLLLLQVGKHRVIASIDPRNEPSIRLVRRLGMRQEGHFRQSLWFKGAWVDDVVFAVLRSEWQQIRSDARTDTTAHADRADEEKH